MGAELSEAMLRPWAQCSAVLWFFCSFIAACRIWKLLAFLLLTKGFKQSVCSQSFYVHPVSKLWIHLFSLSKLVEMGEFETSPYPVCL